MTQVIVRILAWFSIFFYLIMSIITISVIIIDEVNLATVTVFFMFLLMSVIGWYARKYGLKDFQAKRIQKYLAIITLLFGALLLILIPILFAITLGFGNTYSATIVLFIFYSPAVLCSIAIISTKSISSNIVEE